MLFLQAKFLNNSGVTTLVVRFEITEVYATISDHLQETTTRMEVLWVLLEVLRELVDLFRENSNLHIRRTSVSIVPSDACYNGRLFLSRKHRFLYLTTPCLNAQV